MTDQALRTSLTNFIGALIQSSQLPPEKISRNIVAILQEECLKISQGSNKVCSLSVLEPLFKAMLFVLHQRMELLEQEKLDLMPALQAKKQFGDLIRNLEQLLQNIDTTKEDN